MPRKKTETSPLDAPALGSLACSRVRSLRPPELPAFASLEPPGRIDHFPEYRTSSRISFYFKLALIRLSVRSSAASCALVPLGYLASRLSGPARRLGGAWTPQSTKRPKPPKRKRAPELFSDITPHSETEAPKPMTQRRGAGVATPIIGENLLQTMVGAVDTFMVARLGQAAVAGVGTAFEIVFFIISILSAIDVGATVLVSQAIGAADQRRANQLARQAIVWGLVLAIPVSIGIYLAAPLIIALFGTEPDVAVATSPICRSLRPRAALFLSFVCGAVLRGAGDSRTPLAAAVLANIVNVVVAYTLIFGNFGFPALGVAGSALGAAVGRGAGAAYMLVAMARGKKAISLRGSWGWRPHILPLASSSRSVYRPQSSKCSPPARSWFSSRSWPHRDTGARRAADRLHCAVDGVLARGRFLGYRNRAGRSEHRSASSVRRTKGMGDLAALGAGLARHRRCARVRLRRTAHGDLLVRSGSHLVGRARCKR